jgi:hypothetical protein
MNTIPCQAGITTGIIEEQCSDAYKVNCSSTNASDCRLYIGCSTSSGEGLANVNACTSVASDNEKAPESYISGFTSLNTNGYDTQVVKINSVYMGIGNSYWFTLDKGDGTSCTQKLEVLLSVSD